MCTSLVPFKTFLPGDGLRAFRLDSSSLPFPSTACKSRKLITVHHPEFHNLITPQPPRNRSSSHGQGHMTHPGWIRGPLVPFLAKTNSETKGEKRKSNQTLITCQYLVGCVSRWTWEVRLFYASRVRRKRSIGCSLYCKLFAVSNLSSDTDVLYHLALVLRRVGISFKV